MGIKSWKQITIRLKMMSKQAGHFKIKSTLRYDSFVGKLIVHHKNNRLLIIEVKKNEDGDGLNIYKGCQKRLIAKAYYQEDSVRG